ncbi:peptidylprolyl isomerase [Xylanibacter oryzae]|uniref:peptidylprolyl isomerase n=1 Tax=Xylanibacter oryzae TaxID=185293 RepID=UPI0004AE71F4|nr:peptidylprolyl isomerase [Xylanibacter oryzae]
MKNKKVKICVAALSIMGCIGLKAQSQKQTDNTVNGDKAIDEVIWVVGDEAILKSDVEAMRAQSESENIKFKGNPDCAIPEQLAVQKLFLHQAAIDSLQVTESEINNGIEEQINYWIQLIGSREKLEEYKKQTISQMRNQMHDEFRDRQLIQKMKEQLVKDIAVSPADVRAYFKNVPKDSIPYVPTDVEVEIITKTPKVSQEEINRIKDELRDYTDRINKGETSFSSLARLYSEDPGSARQGGELDYTGRGMLDPAFANVAFNLTDPKKISKIVESEYGYHIIQLVDKRGDKIKVRHILLKPHVTDDAINKSISRLDSIANDIKVQKFTFEDAATFISDDKDTKNNHGLMFNATQSGRTSKFKMEDLPSEIAKVVDTLKVGEVSRAFKMINSKGKDVCVIVKLKSKIEGHKATMTEDFQTLKDVVLAKKREETLHNWVVNKIKTTYVRINDRYKNCDFEYQGWIK